MTKSFCDSCGREVNVAALTTIKAASMNKPFERLNDDGGFFGEICISCFAELKTWLNRYRGKVRGEQLDIPDDVVYELHDLYNTIF